MQLVATPVHSHYQNQISGKEETKRKPTLIQGWESMNTTTKIKEIIKRILIYPIMVPAVIFTTVIIAAINGIVAPGKGIKKIAIKIINKFKEIFGAQKETPSPDLSKAVSTSSIDSQVSTEKKPLFLDSQQAYDNASSHINQKLENKWKSLPGILSCVDMGKHGFSTPLHNTLINKVTGADDSEENAKILETFRDNEALLANIQTENGSLQTAKLMAYDQKVLTAESMSPVIEGLKEENPAVTVISPESGQICSEVNAIVKKETRGRISEILTLEPTVAFVHTLYFKALWKNSFDQALTTSKNFTSIAGTETKVQMMHIEKPISVKMKESKEADIPYDKIKLPYKSFGGQDFYFEAYLPKERLGQKQYAQFYANLTSTNALEQFEMEGQETKKINGFPTKDENRIRNQFTERSSG